MLGYPTNKSDWLLCLYKYFVYFVTQGCREPTFECQGLTPNAEYYFRVAAANANGVGPFIETANTTVAKLPFGEFS